MIEIDHTRLNEIRAQINVQKEKAAACLREAARLGEIEAHMVALLALLNGESPPPENNGDGLSERDAMVLRAIKGLESETFTLPDVAKKVNFARNTVKRSIDLLSDQGTIKINKVGYKRRPTLYELVEMK